MIMEEIKEGNQLIAEFMEIERCTRCDPWCGRYCYNPGVYYLPDEMEYNSSWDWLMPACKKFDNLDIDLQEHDAYVDHCSNIDNAAAHYKIEPVFLMLVEGIKWYNKIKEHSKTKTN